MIVILLLRRKRIALVMRSRAWRRSALAPLIEYFILKVLLIEKHVGIHVIILYFLQVLISYLFHLISYYLLSSSIYVIIDSFAIGSFAKFLINWLVFLSQVLWGLSLHIIEFLFLKKFYILIKLLGNHIRIFFLLKLILFNINFEMLQDLFLIRMINTWLII